MNCVVLDFAFKLYGDIRNVSASRPGTQHWCFLFIHKLLFFIHSYLKCLLQSFCVAGLLYLAKTLDCNSS